MTRKKALLLTLVFLFPTTLWADCMGEIRDTTAAEKALYDWVDVEFPKLIHTSNDYARDGNKIGVSRNSRCVDKDGDPLYLSSYLTFALQGEAAEELQMEMMKLFDSRKELMQTTQEMQQAGMDIMEIVAKMDVENQQLDRKNQALQARSRIEVKAYFNNSSAECKGEIVTIPGSLVACRWISRDQYANFFVLFGGWEKKNSEKWYESAYDHSMPTSTVQGLEITVSGSNDAVDELIKRTDWASIRARVGK